MQKDPGSDAEHEGFGTNSTITESLSRMYREKDEEYIGGRITKGALLDVNNETGEFF